MGNWNINIQGTGSHHNPGDGHWGDANRLASRFVQELKDAGHQLQHATFTHGSAERLDSDTPPRGSPLSVNSYTTPAPLVSFSFRKDDIVLHRRSDSETLTIGIVQEDAVANRSSYLNILCIARIRGVGSPWYRVPQVHSLGHNPEEGTGEEVVSVPLRECVVIHTPATARGKGEADAKAQ